ncbi:MAG: hypothetical protein HY852_06045 [Bradyrhizobium sp.]|uniref:hypothetical protein n=1 Tax=Bradyrhizobium sp. TaxID=376 RepID=UPI0025BCFA25|nr:hypothetical protein [Bradyrhizobium sp.]MBI5261365.1 hypothetical protein [Bradyrhizobium sp.]
MKLSKGGVISAGIYLAFLVLAIGMMLLSGDHMYFALALLPALITGLHGLIPDSWPAGGYAGLVLSLLISYVFGWFIGGLARGLYRLNERLFRRSGS